MFNSYYSEIHSQSSLFVMSNSELPPTAEASSTEVPEGCLHSSRIRNHEDPTEEHQDCEGEHEQHRPGTEVAGQRAAAHQDSLVW